MLFKWVLLYMFEMLLAIPRTAQSAYVVNVVLRLYYNLNNDFKSKVWVIYWVGKKEKSWRNEKEVWLR